MYVIWKWGTRWVNIGKVLDQSDKIIIVEITDFKGVNHHLVLPKGSFKFKYFDTLKEAEEYFKGENEKERVC